MPTFPAYALLADTSEEHGPIYEFFHSGAFGIFFEGGIFMWPILVLLILLLTMNAAAIILRNRFQRHH